MKLAYIFIFSFILSSLLLSLAYFLSYKMMGEEVSPFECGFFPVYESRSSISIQFFIISLIFLVFDVELILLFPYIFSISASNSVKSMILLIFFFFFLSASAIYEWMGGMLEWVKF